MYIACQKYVKSYLLDYSENIQTVSNVVEYGEALEFTNVIEGNLMK